MEEVDKLRILVIQVIGGHLSSKDLLFKGERILQPYSFETNPNFSLRIPKIYNRY